MKSKSSEGNGIKAVRFVYIQFAFGSMWALDRFGRLWCGKTKQGLKEIEFDWYLMKMPDKTKTYIENDLKQFIKLNFENL